MVGIWLLTAAFAVLLVSYVVSRFWPQARRPLIALAVVVVGATWFAPGFDLKTVLALMTGLGLSAAELQLSRRKKAGLGCAHAAFGA